MGLSVASVLSVSPTNIRTASRRCAAVEVPGVLA
jgi:hypothetical protein